MWRADATGADANPARCGSGPGLHTRNGSIHCEPRAAHADTYGDLITYLDTIADRHYDTNVYRYPDAGRAAGGRVHA